MTEIKKIVRKPLYVEARRHNPTSSRITGTSVVEDLMIHDIDVLVHLFRSSGLRVLEPRNAATSARPYSASATCPVSLSASRKSSKKIRSIYIEEEDLTIEGDFMTQEVRSTAGPTRTSRSTSGTSRRT